MHDIQVIGSKIMTLPNRPPFMLDRDLAIVYGTTTKRINEAVKRNPDRFPKDFIFQLTKREAESCDFDQMFEVADCDLKDENFESTDCDLKDKDFKVTDCDLKKNNRGGRRYIPYGFTRDGCNMLSAVLTTPTAVARSVQIMRAFSAMERWGSVSMDIVEKLANAFSRMDKRQTLIEERLSAIETMPSTFVKQAGKETPPVTVGQKQIRCPMGEQFVSAIEELICSKRVQIILHFSDDISISNLTTIGFYNDNDPWYVYLFPKTTMNFIRRLSFEREDLSLNLSTTAMGKQLLKEGYIAKPKAYTTFAVKVLGAGGKAVTQRVWKFKAKKFKSEHLQNGNMFSTYFPKN